MHKTTDKRNESTGIRPVLGCDCRHVPGCLQAGHRLRWADPLQETRMHRADDPPSHLGVAITVGNVEHVKGLEVPAVAPSRPVTAAVPTAQPVATPDEATQVWNPEATTASNTAAAIEKLRAEVLAELAQLKADVRLLRAFCSPLPKYNKKSFPSSQSRPAYSYQYPEGDARPYEHESFRPNLGNSSSQPPGPSDTPLGSDPEDLPFPSSPAGAGTKLNYVHQTGHRGFVLPNRPVVRMNELPDNQQDHERGGSFRRQRSFPT